MTGDVLDVEAVGVLAVATSNLPVVLEGDCDPPDALAEVVAVPDVEALSFSVLQLGGADLGKGR
jgi:hypothetical protein